MILPTPLLLTLITFLSLCWGSFLGCLSFRITFDKPLFTKRSHCPSCNHIIAWYDNIPLFSWFFLKGSCRTCSARISPIYPFIEFLTAICMTGLFYKTFSTSLLTSNVVITFCFHGIFISALIGSTATDLFDMVIPQAFSIYLVPLGVLGAYSGFLGIDHISSMLGAMFGYGFLKLVAYVFKKYTDHEGMGVGDMELLCLIGSFTGLEGCWITLLLASVGGLIIGGAFLHITNQSKRAHIPFGPFLAMGAIVYVLFTKELTQLFLFR